MKVPILEIVWELFMNIHGKIKEFQHLVEKYPGESIQIGDTL